MNDNCWLRKGLQGKGMAGAAAKTKPICRPGAGRARPEWQACSSKRPVREASRPALRPPTSHSEPHTCLAQNKANFAPGRTPAAPARTPSTPVFHHSNIPSFPPPPCPGRELLCKTKPIRGEAGRTPIAFPERGYEKEVRPMSPQKQSQFAGRPRGVPGRSLKRGRRAIRTTDFELRAANSTPHAQNKANLPGGWTPMPALPGPPQHSIIPIFRLSLPIARHGQQRRCSPVCKAGPIIHHQSSSSIAENCLWRAGVECGRIAR
jgi:hypothetical protein